MKRLAVLLPIALLCVACFAAGSSSSRLHFSANKFSIAALEGTSKDTIYQAIMMFLPVTDRFAPNVNVQIQPFSGTMQDYAKLSSQQMTTGKCTILREKVIGKTSVWEYTGMLQGRKLHWYARATLAKGKVYLVTATAAETQWKAVKAKLSACVDSFKLEAGK